VLTEIGYEAAPIWAERVAMAWHEDGTAYFVAYARWESTSKVQLFMAADIMERIGGMVESKWQTFRRENVEGHQDGQLKRRYNLATAVRLEVMEAPLDWQSEFGEIVTDSAKAFVQQSARFKGSRRPKGARNAGKSQAPQPSRQPTPG